MIDAGDFLRDPETYLRWLCDWLGIAFTPRMLSWPAGPRASDGVWAPYWYDAVLALHRLRALASPRGVPEPARRGRRRGLPAGLRHPARPAPAALTPSRRERRSCPPDPGGGRP